jgi:LytS/YehU family sensor histidine kinase
MVHLPASLIITTLHLTLIAVWRFFLQGVRGGDPQLMTTIADAFFRTVDQILPVYWAIIGLQHAVDYYRQARAREVRAARLETRLVESQLQALQQQLHPHFLFNTLHAISTLVHRDPDKADAMIERLSDLLRVTLRKVGVQEVELAQELEYLRAYLDIEQIHFGDRLRIEYRIDAAALDVLVPTLMLQPLVENAVRHGLEPLMRPGTLTIEARTDGDTMWLRVRDDGIGFSKTWRRREGVGLSNTRSRLDRLYGERSALTIRENPGGGGVVDVYIPLRRLEKAGSSEAVA